MFTKKTLIGTGLNRGFLSMLRCGAAPGAYPVPPVNINWKGGTEQV
jgi:hypothetical protein